MHDATGAILHCFFIVFHCFSLCFTAFVTYVHCFLLTGSYDLAFWLVGGLYAVAGALVCVVAARLGREKKAAAVQP